MRNYTQLAQAERYRISAMIAICYSHARIATELGVHKSTISRELLRNGGRFGYDPDKAHKMARKRKLDRTSPRIDVDTWDNVECCLHLDMSPEQTHLYLKSKGLQTISHERIYQYIRSDRKAGGNLYKRLRGRSHHKNKYGGSDNRGKIKGPSIDMRPAVVDERSVIGDWEADTIIGKGSKHAVVTLVERKSRKLLIKTVYGKTANEVAEAIITLLKPFRLTTLSITVDNGKEFARFKKISKELGVAVYFAHPYHAWERGTNENTNGLIRQYFPKGMDFSKITEVDIDYVMHRLNTRPRKILGMKTPNQVFYGSRNVALAT